MSIEVDVVQDDPNRVMYEYTKEDHDAVKGPGLVQGMLQGEEDEDEDDDSSDDNPDILFKKLEDAGIRAPEAARYQEAKARAQKEVERK